jgi:hypothetical protein
VVGWLAPQIMIFYNFGERIARSVTFNVADFLGGNVSFVQGVGNVAVDTINSFITLANDELAFFLPPLPPIPPMGGFAAAESSVLKVADVEALTKATLPRPRDAIRALEAALNPVHTDVTKDPGTETTKDSAVEDSRTHAAVNKFVKRLTATSGGPPRSRRPVTTHQARNRPSRSRGTRASTRRRPPTGQRQRRPTRPARRRTAAQRGQARQSGREGLIVRA